MLLTPVCVYCKLPLKPGQSFRVHPQCWLRRGAQIERNPQLVSPQVHAFAEALLRWRPPSPPSRSTPSKPHLRVVK
jgi:hypothetical protein